MSALSRRLGIAEGWRGVYRDLRESGSGRIDSFLLATGLWCAAPFRWHYPEDAPVIGGLLDDLRRHPSDEEAW